MRADAVLYTEREVIERERAAYLNGVDAAGMLYVTRHDWGGKSIARYPLPKVMRPRVVCDPHRRTNLTGEVIHYRVDREAFSEPTVVVVNEAGWSIPDITVSVTGTRVALWADLLARPTEEVEA